MYETRTFNGALVMKIKMIGVPMCRYSAWEPNNRHQTQTHHDERSLGEIARPHFPDAFEALPAMTEHRRAAVHAWQQSNYERAYAHIIGAFPETINGRKVDGEIEVWLTPDEAEREDAIARQE